MESILKSVLGNGQYFRLPMDDWFDKYYIFECWQNENYREDVYLTLFFV